MYGSDNTCMSCGKRISEDFDQCIRCYREEIRMKKAIPESKEAAQMGTEEE